MLMAALLSPYSNVHPDGGKPSSMRIDSKYLILATSNEFTQALRHNRVGASGSDVVDLSAQKDDLLIDHISVDAALV
jgi:hypothetical protein